MQTFLIRCGDKFLRAWKGINHEPTWTDIPSLAAHFDYPNADAVAQDLQENGFKGAFVSNCAGEPATAAVIRRESSRQDSGVGVLLATDPGY